jgi:hypothetical protein
LNFAAPISSSPIWNRLVRAFVCSRLMSRRSVSVPSLQVFNRGVCESRTFRADNVGARLLRG